MKSKFAETVQSVKQELIKETGAVQIDPSEVEGIMRWAAQGDPNTFKQFSNLKGDQFLGSMVNAYRQQQQKQPAQQNQPQTTQQTTQSQQTQQPQNSAVGQNQTQSQPSNQGM